MNGGASIATTAAAGAADGAGSSRRPRGLRVLGGAFMLFNSMRLLAYLPTTWAIYTTGDSSQHSLWTWCTWLGANLTMAVWLRERNDHRVDQAVLVSIGNAAMCLATVVVIVHHRL